MTTPALDHRTTQLLALMKRGDDAFNARDLEAMEAVHHRAAVVHTTGSDVAVDSWPPHRDQVQWFIDAFPDVHVHNDPYDVQFGGGDWVTVISRITGTFTGHMPGADGTVVPPTGRSFDPNFSTTCRWDDSGRLVEEYIFWDSALMNTQVGIA